MGIVLKLTTTEEIVEQTWVGIRVDKAIGKDPLTDNILWEAEEHIEADDFSDLDDAIDHAKVFLNEVTIELETPARAVLIFEQTIVTAYPEE
jgi:hypothetical protein